MSEPMWLGGDPASYEDPASDDVYEFDCGNDDCEYHAEVPAQRWETSRVTRITAEWVCPECKYENSSETEWDNE
jgi:rubredoxin